MGVWVAAARVVAGVPPALALCVVGVVDGILDLGDNIRAILAGIHKQSQDHPNNTDHNNGRNNHNKLKAQVDHIRHQLL